jgi:hypothetical protein
MVMAAFPGTYTSFQAVLEALGPAASRLSLTQGTTDLEVFRELPWRSRGLFEPGGEGSPERPEVSTARGDDTAEYERFQEVSLDAGAAPTSPSDAKEPTGGSDARLHSSLVELMQKGREAIEREDWGGLLEVALLIAEGESEAPSELIASSYRIELKRLMTRKHLAMMARFLQGERKQEAILLLRRFGPDATEVLMDLLIQAMTIGERRGYYSAITQMNAGSDAIIQQLRHPEWYVVRNAADLCGEMGLAGAVPHLALQVSHPDERVRKAVAEALGKIGTLPAMEPLRPLVADPSPVVRLKALAHLGGRNSRALSPAIGELLKAEDNPDVQHEALLALGRIGSPESIGQLREWVQPGGKVLGRKSPALRLAAVRGLGLAGPAAIDVLVTLQRDASPEVRAAATAALDALRPRL